MGFLFPFKPTTLLPSSFPPSLRLHRTCDWREGAPGVNTGPGGRAGAGVVVCDPTEHNCRTGNGPKEERKMRGCRASVSSFSDHQVTSVGGWGGGV